MNVDEAIGRGAPGPISVPRLGLDLGRRRGLTLAWVIAVLLHVLVPLSSLVLLRTGAGRVADVARPQATPVRVVFYETQPAARSTPPPATVEHSSLAREAASAVTPVAASESRQPAAQGSSTEHRAEVASARPSPPPTAAPPALASQDPADGRPDAEPSPLSNFASSLLAHRPPPSGRRAPWLREPVADAAEPPAPSLSGSAIAAAVRQQGFHNPSSAVSSTGPLEFDAKDFEWGPYAEVIYRIVDRNWKSVIPLAAKTPGVRGRVVLRFRIQRSGRVVALELLESAGRTSLDQAALASIEISNPLPPLPSEFPSDDVGVTFSYHYNLPVR